MVFICTDVTTASGWGRPTLSALIGGWGSVVAVAALRDSIKGRTAGKQSVRESGATVVLERPQIWVCAETVIAAVR